jgi:hypothetical protein
MDLTVELHAEMIPGKHPWWVAHTNRFHFPGWNGTAMGEGSSPNEAIDRLAEELDKIAVSAIVEPERVEGTIIRTDEP